MSLTVSSIPTYKAKDRVQLPFQFDVAKMQAEIEALNFNTFLYYNVLPLRAPAHTIDPSIPMPPPVEDFADGSWTEWLDTGALKKSPYLTSIVDIFRKHTKVTLVRLLRLEGGAVVKEHTDPHKVVNGGISQRINLTIDMIPNEWVRSLILDNQ